MRMLLHYAIHPASTTSLVTSGAQAGSSVNNYQRFGVVEVLAALEVQKLSTRNIAFLFQKEA